MTRYLVMMAAGFLAALSLYPFLFPLEWTSADGLLFAGQMAIRLGALVFLVSSLHHIMKQSADNVEPLSG